MASVVDEIFWKNKKVFLTGHTGFKGSWLSLWLHSMGAKVFGYSLAPTTNPSLFEAAKISSIVESEINNICDYELLLTAIKKAQPEIVIHMAAQALVRYSYDSPLETYQTNVMGSANLLQACRFVESVKTVVNVTSDKCYENMERIGPGYREDEPMGGHDPYSSSKGCAELVTSAFRKSYFTNKKGIASGRAGNVIGGGDWAMDRLLPDIFRSIDANSKVIIRNPNSIRPWQHVLEPLSGYLLLAQKLHENLMQYSEGFNFGPHEKDAKEVEYIVKKVVDLWGDKASYSIQESNKNPHEAHYLKLDTAKAQKVLGWKPKWSLDEALEKTVDWQKSFSANKALAHEISLNQINEYQKS